MANFARAREAADRKLLHFTDEDLHDERRDVKKPMDVKTYYGGEPVQGQAPIDDWDGTFGTFDDVPEQVEPKTLPRPGGI